jgi:hypothetical protein
MTKAKPNADAADQDGPPIFRTWHQMYAFVLLLHAVIILLFYLFTKAYS